MNLITMSQRGGVNWSCDHCSLNNEFYLSICHMVVGEFRLAVNRSTYADKGYYNMLPVMETDYVHNHEPGIYLQWGFVNFYFQICSLFKFVVKLTDYNCVRLKPHLISV